MFLTLWAGSSQARAPAASTRAQNFYKHTAGVSGFESRPVKAPGAGNGSTLPILSLKEYNSPPHEVEVVDRSFRTKIKEPALELRWSNPQSFYLTAPAKYYSGYTANRLTAAVDSTHD